jgi:hypothetical protein
MVVQSFGKAVADEERNSREEAQKEEEADGEV